MTLHEQNRRRTKKEIIVSLIFAALIGLAVGLVGRMIVMELRK